MKTDASTSPEPQDSSRLNLRALAPRLALLLILAVGAYLRFSGLNWDAGTHLHPDERFLTIVESSIKPVSSLGEYFDTSRSTLNPNNVGHGFYVYGTLPLFVVRYVGEWLGRTGYDQVHLVGRAGAAVFDLVTILLVYLLGTRLYGRRVGILAAAFSALSVLLIQHAHFFVVDPFMTTFVMAGLYFAIVVQDEGGWQNYALFGFFTGMAVASKISAAPLAGMVALAAGVRAYKSENQSDLHQAILGVSLAAFISIFTFRVLQPYAFQGTSFFDIRLNPKWLATLSELRRQVGGEVDFPPALQWADRTPVWFSFKNMVLWGLGLPLGVTAWVSWAWALYRTIKGRGWDRHVIPVVWTGGYFLWRATGFTQTMRNLLPIYPMLAILAAWGLWTLYDRASARTEARRWAQAGTVALGAGILAATAFYAFGFLKIYTTPMTRVQASRWIFSHVPSAVNVVIETDQGEKLEPLAVPQDFVLRAGQPTTLSFTAHRGGRAASVLTPFVHKIGATSGPERLSFALFEDGVDGEPISEALYEGELPASGETRLELELAPAVDLRDGGSYSIRLELEGTPAVELGGNPALIVETPEGDQLTDVRLPTEQFALSAGTTETLPFTAHSSGEVRAVRMPHLEMLQGGSRELAIDVVLGQAGGGSELASASIASTSSTREGPLDIRFENEVSVREGERYELQLSLTSGLAVEMRGPVIVHETSWDDPMPARIDGFDIGGRYNSRNLELYWADDEDRDADGVPDKQERIVESLSEGHYLFISSNRQYGTIARVPSRYPLSTTFFRELFSCPPPRPVWHCADQAAPGEVDNDFGYELVKVFESNPRLFGAEISDQGAEEAFTVYDHPQVMVFAKSERYNPAVLRRTLSDVDISNLRNVPPIELEAGTRSTLLISDQRWRSLRQGGTWSELFPPEGLLNRSQPVAVVAWWAAIALLGWAAFPLTRRAFPGLEDGGYALTRVVGLLVFAWVAWIAGSFGVSVSRSMLALVAIGLLALGGVVAWRDRRAIIELLRRRKSEILWVEALVLAFFAFDLIIRIGNPDLWHPARGGEKPMDLSYLNAVLKSRTFPPFDPWFAGGYINYYYFGFVFIGLPMKLLGIDPSIAYNLAVPTLFALSAVAAYSVGYHLAQGVRSEPSVWLGRLGGLAAAALLVLLGNLGTARMLFDAFQTVAGAAAAGAQNIIVDAFQALAGFAAVVGGADLPIGLGSWYWDPSRAILPAPGESGPITEFPLFTFVYADLHAHMIALPLTVAVLAWGVSWLRGAARRQNIGRAQFLWALFIGALVVGSLRPTNTWDFPVYLILAALAAAAAPLVRAEKFNLKSVAKGLMAAGLLVGLALLLYRPYTRWYVQGYTQADIWQGSKTQIPDYLVVHGLFLFLVLSWFVWETREWMAATPLSALSRLRPYFGPVAVAALVLAAATVTAATMGYPTVLIVVPLLVWAGILILRPGQRVVKRVGYFLAATGLALTLMVEVVVLQGDIGRMNTVFKFYLQVWTLLSVVGGAALAWIAYDLPRWSPGWRSVWQSSLAVLVFAAALYPITAIPAKIRDRMASEAPHTLDGMAFMRYAERHELGESFSLTEDYEAMHWMQANVEGSPVIVEANIPEYRWGSRYTIYTGLPGVLGWNWHQRQQRVAEGAQDVSERADAITAFFTEPSAAAGQDFLDQHQVRYIIVGRLERIYYADVQPCFPAGEAGQSVTCDLSGRPLGMASPDVSPEACTRISPETEAIRLRCPTGGIDKFSTLVEQGVLEVVFQIGNTTVYEVVR